LFNKRVHWIVFWPNSWEGLSTNSSMVGQKIISNFDKLTM